MYVVTGATGNTGRVVAERLLAAGEQVRALGRDRERLQPLVKQGAQACIGSLEDADWLERIFRGARGVYAMMPPAIREADVRAYQDRVGSGIAGALAAAGVQRVVHLSSIGAQLAEGAGPVSGLHAQEKRLDALPGASVLHLRAGFFMENLHQSAGSIRTAGMIAAPVRSELALPWIATVDIGTLAARALQAAWEGKVTRELHGERDLSYPEVTRAIGAAIGHPDLEFVQTSYEEAHRSLLRTGISPDMTRCLIEMYHAINDERMKPLEERSKGNTTPTSIERFAQDFAAAI
ncbi:MAG: NmrA family NAD(P)-binding protein [Planctomycetota bacterium]|jgi:uncharacterized protein YbjT (DUF2867 family)